MTEIKSLLVYCGANEGFHPMYGEAAKKLGMILAREKIKLIFGFNIRLYTIMIYFLILKNIYLLVITRQKTKI